MQNFANFFTAFPEFLFSHRNACLGSIYSLTSIKDVSGHKCAVKSDAN